MSPDRRNLPAGMQRTSKIYNIEPSTEFTLIPLCGRRARYEERFNRRSSKPNDLYNQLDFGNSNRFDETIQSRKGFSKNEQSIPLLLKRRGYPPEADRCEDFLGFAEIIFQLSSLP